MAPLCTASPFDSRFYRSHFKDIRWLRGNFSGRYYQLLLQFGSLGSGIKRIPFSAPDRAGVSYPDQYHVHLLICLRLKVFRIT